MTQTHSASKTCERNSNIEACECDSEFDIHKYSVDNAFVLVLRSFVFRTGYRYHLHCSAFRLTQSIVPQIW